MKFLRQLHIDIIPLLAYVIVCCIVFAIMREQVEYASLGVSCAYIYVLFSYFYNIAYRERRLFKIDAVMMVLMVMTFVNVTISGSGGFEYYKKMIMFFASMMWMLICSRTSLTKNTIKLVFIISIIIALLYVFYFRSGWSEFEGETLLSLHFSNPNLAGMFLLVSALYLSMMLFSGELFNLHLFFRIMVLGGLVSNLYLILLTGCRSSLLAYVFFIMLVILDYISKGNFRLKHWMIFLWAILPLVFAIVYVLHASSISDVSVSLVAVQEGAKENSSRLPVWLPAFESIVEHPITGDYYGISGGTGMSQMHNTHVDVLASYGLLPFVLFIYMLYRCTVNVADGLHSRFQRVSLYAFLSCFISGVFEAALVSGSTGFFLIAFGFLLLANYSSYENSPS